MPRHRDGDAGRDKVVLGVKISGCAEKAGTLDKDVKRAVKAAQDHAINLTLQRAKGGQG